MEEQTPHVEEMVEANLHEKTQSSLMELHETEERVEQVRDLQHVHLLEKTIEDLYHADRLHDQIPSAELQTAQQNKLVEEEERPQELHLAEEQKQPDFLQIQSDQNEVLHEQHHAEAIDLNNAQDDQIQFELQPCEGPSAPPPTPTGVEYGNKLGLRSFEHIEVHEKPKAPITNQDEAETSEPAQEKKPKRAGFKVESGKSPNKHQSAEYDHASKEELDVHARDEEEEKRKTECTRYAGFERFVGNFIDKIIDKSINSVAVERGMHLEESTHINEEDATSLSSLRSFVEAHGSVMRWPRIHEFTREMGESMIDEYMQTWEYEEDWMYCIDFLLEQSDECSDYYLYEAKWSIPSKPYPIPQATASVYFTIEVSRVKPGFCPVDVSYLFEGSRLRHTPGKISFQEHWLFSIIDAKLELYKQLKF